MKVMGAIGAGAIAESNGVARVYIRVLSLLRRP